MNTLLNEIFIESLETSPVWNNETTGEFEWGKKLKNAAAGALFRAMEWVADGEGQEQKKREKQRDDTGIVVEDKNKKQSTGPGVKQTPLQEIFQEAEREWAGELEGFLDTGKKDEPPPTKRETPNAKKAWGEYNPDPPQQPSKRRQFEVPLMQEIFTEAEANNGAFLSDVNTTMEYMVASNKQLKPKRTAQQRGGSGTQKTDATLIFVGLLKSRLRQEGIVEDQDHINKWQSKYSQKLKDHKVHIHMDYNEAVTNANDYLDKNWTIITKNKR